mgnify:FL=1
MSGEIREARAAIAQALQGLTMNDQPVNVYADYPRQWALPALAVGPASGDYVVQERLGAARVNFTVIAATTPANNAADLAALEDMAVLVLNRLTVTEPIASPTYTDLGSIEAATIYLSLIHI